MNQHYNQNYSREQIVVILATIQDCIREDKFIISKNENRQENIDFISEYNLNNRRQKGILLKIQPEDFCHSLQNTKKGFTHEVLYVFCPQVMLFNFDGIKESVDIYTKFNIIDSDRGKRVVVISFHNRNKAIDYRFR
ncbi:MAG TPA: hypothetical protein DD734_04885 [Firmicutes bacterium]|jgi:hypothetical protein|nr:hypothetical protein [Bacillota bacterium]HBR33948.1 hypothetical protein [Bacillota bacterium]